MHEAGAALLFSHKRLQFFVLMLPVIIYLFGTYAVGDALSRYLFPVEWVGFIFAGVVIDFAIIFAFKTRIFAKKYHDYCVIMLDTFVPPWLLIANLLIYCVFTVCLCASPVESN